MNAFEARQISNKVNIEYENASKKDFLTDEELKNFLIKTIEMQAAIGCIDLEFETEKDLTNNKILTYFSDNGYKVNFYKLNEKYASNKYCLNISW